jgi:transcriptional regulator
MYLPKAFAEPDLATLHDLVEAHAFGVLVVPTPSGAPEVSHLPFLLDRARGPHGTLRAHVARANPIWRAFDGKAEVLAVFQGPHGYVSPTWYASRDDVPTWNYAVVHAHGAPRLIEAEAELLDLLRRLADVHEQGRPDPWSTAELSAGTIGELLPAIVGFELPIARIVGKLKLSQNRRPEDREGAIRGLRERGTPDDLALVKLMGRPDRGPAPT